jgi:hypothetical protein
VPRERIGTAWAAVQDRAWLAAELAAFRARLAGPNPDEAAPAERAAEREPAE